MELKPARSPGAQAGAGSMAGVVPGRPADVVLYRVWERPVRITHWFMFLSVLTLCVTGYLIARPPFSAPTEASNSYVHGTIRYIHFVAAYVLLFSFLIRLYWGFVGNRFCRWSNMLPITRRRWQGIWVEIDSLLFPWKGHYVYTGHAPLASVIYLCAYAGVIVALGSGFIHYAQSHYSPFWRWVAGTGLSLFGYNLKVIHLVHHQMLWFFVVYFIAHIYMVAYTMGVSRTTEVDTMVTGRKFVHRDDLSPYDE